MATTQKTEDDELIKKPAIVLPECEDMLNEVAAYIWKDSPEQADIMMEQFSKSRRMIERMPGIGTPYKNGMRKTGLGKFRRYNIYYREKENEIEILGVWHTSRGTGFDG